jgi:1,4-dihydroxy-6-naphthoate synthase
MKRSLGAELIGQVEALIRESILHARSNPDESASYIKGLAQELSDDVIASHITLYVNDYSVDIGAEGEAAVNALFDMAASRGLIKPSGVPLFAAKANSE